MTQKRFQLEEPMNRRQFVKAAAGTSLGLAALLAGCGNTAGGSSLNSNGSAAIGFLTVQAPKTGWELILSTLTDQYAKSHPGTTFKADNIPQANLNQQATALAGSGSLPVLYNTPSSDIVSQLLKNGEALDVEVTFQQLGVSGELLPQAVSVIKQSYRNQMAALPFELNIEGFWYNKQIFSQHGLQPPDTWDQLVQIAATLQQKGIQPFTASGQQGWPLVRLIGYYINRKLGPDAMSAITSGQFCLTDPSYVEGAQALAALGKQGYFGRGFATLDYQTAENLFLQGKAAMYFMGSWAVCSFTDPSVNKIGADNVGFFQFPNVVGGAGTSSQTPMNCGLPSSINKQKYNSTIGQWFTYIAKNYGDTSLKLEGVVSCFTLHSPPANLAPLTTMVINQIKQVQQPLLYFDAGFSAKAQNLAYQDAAPLTLGSMSPANYMSAVQADL